MQIRCLVCGSDRPPPGVRPPRTALRPVPEALPSDALVPTPSVLQRYRLWCNHCKRHLGRDKLTYYQ